MRVSTVISFLRTNGVAPGYANDLLNIQAIYERIFAWAYDFLHDQFYYQVEAPWTPADTYTGTAGTAILTAGAALSGTIDQYLGREFLNDDTPVMVVGADYTANTLRLSQPLAAAVVGGTAITFFRRRYAPTSMSGDYLGSVRSSPTHSAASRFNAPAPTRMTPSAVNQYMLAGVTGSRSFSYLNAPMIPAPALAPTISNSTTGGTPVDSGDYRAYVANKLGPLYSDLSPASALFTKAGPIPAGHRGLATAVEEGYYERVFVVEGPCLPVDGLPGVHSTTGLRIVSEGSALTSQFEYSQAALLKLPAFRTTAGSVMVAYAGQPDLAKNSSCSGWPYKRRIRSYNDELQFDERMLIVWRELAKHLETGDGKHFMAARGALAAVLGSGQRR